LNKVVVVHPYGEVLGFGVSGSKLEKQDEQV
jgi:hypothetical protein